MFTDLVLLLLCQTINEMRWRRIVVTASSNVVMCIQRTALCSTVCQVEQS
jgi:hypothetical protein